MPLFSLSVPLFIVVQGRIDVSEVDVLELLLQFHRRIALLRKSHYGTMIGP